MKNTLLVLVLSAITATTLAAQSAKILAQKVVEEIKAAHPEITGIELSATKPGKGCQNIAATEVNEIGEKCDKEDLTVMKTDRPFVEQEKKGFEVTLPIHDSAGKVIAAAGLDYRREVGRTKDTVASEAAKVAADRAAADFRGRAVPAGPLAKDLMCLVCAALPATTRYEDVPPSVTPPITPDPSQST